MTAESGDISGGSGDDSAFPWARPLRLLRDSGPIYVAAPIDELLNIVSAPVLAPRFALMLLCEAAESTVQFLAITGLADVAASNGGKLPASFPDELRKSLQQPTFGIWRATLSAISELRGEDTTVLSRLRVAAADFQKLSAPRRIRAEHNDIVELRNTLAHGKGTSDTRCRELLDLWGPRVCAFFAGLPWLSEISLWAGDLGGPKLLRGPSPLDRAPGRLPPVELRAGEMIAALGERIIWLAPFGRLAAPSADQQTVPQVFMRREGYSLTYGLIRSDAALQAQGEESDASHFDALLDLQGWRDRLTDKSMTELGFEAEIDKETRSFAGREDDLAAVSAAIDATSSGVIWVQGEAGIGKSAFLGKAAAVLAAEVKTQARNVVVRTYRFSDTQHRYSAGPFYRWLIERIDPVEGGQWLSKARRIEEMQEQALQLIRSTAREGLVFFIDGLDVIERHDPGFCATLLETCKALPKLLLVLSGQPVAGLPELIDRMGAVRPFAENLKPMTTVDLRAMIDLAAPRAMSRFVRQDEGSEGFRNAFVDRLVERSKGLPLYVKLVIDDIQRGNLKRFDATEAAELKGSVDDYHRKLLVQAGIGDAAAFRVHVLCIFALAYEPLDIDVISALLARILGASAQFEGARDPKDMVRRIISDLGGVLRDTTRADGSIVWSLYHDEFSSFLLTVDEVGWTRGQIAARLAEAGVSPGDPVSKPYLLRTAVRHLIRMGRIEQATQQISKVAYQIDRLATLSPQGGDGGIRADWNRIMDAAKISGTLEQLPPDALAWRAFWSTDGARFIAEPDAVQPRDFVECALTYHPRTEIGKAIDTVQTDRFRPMITWDRRVRKPDAADGTFWGHKGRVLGVVELPGERLLSWAEDRTLRLWSFSGEAIGKPMVMPSREIVTGFVLEDGRIVSLGRSVSDRLFPTTKPTSAFTIWDADGSPCQPETEIDWKIVGGRPVEGGFETFQVADYIIAIHAPAIMRWTLNGQLSESSPTLDARQVRARGHGSVLVEFFTSVSIEDIKGPREQFTLPKEFGLERAFVLASGRTLLVAYNSGAIACDARLQPLFTADLAIKGGAELADGRIMAWGAESIYVWDGASLAATYTIPDRIWFEDSVMILPLQSGSFCALHRGLVEQCFDILDGDFNARSRFPAPSVSDIMELSNGKLLGWGDGLIHLYDLSRQAAEYALPAATLSGLARETASNVAGQLERLRDDVVKNASFEKLSGKARKAFERETQEAKDTLGLFPLHRQAIADLAADPEKLSLNKFKSMGRKLGKATGAAFVSLFSEKTYAEQMFGQYSQHSTLRLPNGRYFSWQGLEGKIINQYGDLVRKLDTEDYVSGARLVGHNRFLTWGGGRERRLQVWDMDGNHIKDISPHTDSIVSFTELSDGRYLTASDDKTLRILSPDCDIISGPMVGHDREVLGALELDDGRLLSWSRDRTLRVWTSEGKPLRRHLYFFGEPKPATDMPMVFVQIKSLQDREFLTCRVDRDVQPIAFRESR